MTVPDWLTRHDANLQLAPDGRTWLVLIAGTPQYKLVPTPADGQYGYAVVQTNNGKRLDAGQSSFASTMEALDDGLTVLQKKLGW